jgi:hypothetical protein
MQTKGRHTSKIWASTERRLTTDMVFCVAKDENSVDIICRRFLVKILPGMPNMTNPAGATIGAECGNFV